MKSKLKRLGCAFLACAPVGASVQYCAKDAEQGVDFCLSMAAYRNDSTDGSDLYLTLGAVDRPGEGWMAVGIGELMAGSLMFVTATDENEQSIVSARTTRGHFPPEADPELVPRTSMISVNSTIRGWREVSFVCYSCDSWASFQPQSTDKPWIWASNGYQKNEHADDDFGLQIHNSLGFFYVDMTEVMGDNSQPAGPPPIDRGAGSYGASATPLTDESTPKPSPSSSRSWHGFLLFLAFLILYPAGAAASILKRGNWFHIHVCTQILGTGACLVGVALQASSLAGAGLWRRLLDAHPFLGTLLTLLVLAQLVLGYWHHVEFVRKQKKTTITAIHLWNGRLILALGAVNTLMGLMYARASSSWKYFWGFIAALEVILFLVVLPRFEASNSRKTRVDDMATNGGGDEATAHLLLESEEANS